jgi:hypothetical protein
VKASISRSLPGMFAPKYQESARGKRGHAHAAQTVEEIEAGEARAYNDDVEIFDRAFARLFCRRAHDGAIV